VQDRLLRVERAGAIREARPISAVACDVGGVEALNRLRLRIHEGQPGAAAMPLAISQRVFGI